MKFKYGWIGDNFVIQHIDGETVTEVRFTYEIGDRIFDKFMEAGVPEGEVMEEMDSDFTDGFEGTPGFN